MNIHNINIISRYETRLLRRSWLFRIFAVLSLLIIVFFQFVLQSNLWGVNRWSMIAMPSSLPFVNVYLFNIAQSIIAIFLAGNFLKRDQKLDTAEVIYVRPMSNADYIIGKTWGIIRVFVSLNVITLIIAGFIHIFASDSPFSFLPYIFYLLSLSVPSLVFILGLSFVVMSFVRNQAVTFILMLGFIGGTLLYLGDVKQGMFDFFALTVPNVFSEVLGHTNLAPYLTQRVTFLLFGMGLLAFTIALVKRIPLHPRKNMLLNAIGVAILIAGLGEGYMYYSNFHHIHQQRLSYTEKYKKYNASDKVNLLSQEIAYSQNKHVISVAATLKVQNQNHKTIHQVLFYLNPSLKVEKLSSKGEPVPYEREAQVIAADCKLLPNETVEFQISYQGSIEESVCYLDVTDEEYYNTQNGSNILRFGKNYAYLSDKFTLLTPECLWYPTTFPPVNPETPYHIRKNFATFSLKVYNPGKRDVLSQGAYTQTGDTIVFANDDPLPGISLVIGDYEKKSVAVDSLQIELYHFKGHDYFSSEFTHMADTLAGFLSDIKTEYEMRKGRKYPFRKFVLAEAPVSYAGYVRNWKGNSEQIQPEMVFLPEFAVSLPRSNFKNDKKRMRRWSRIDSQEPEEMEMEMEVLRDFIHSVFQSEENFQEDGNFFVNMITRGWSSASKLNRYDISSMYFNYANSIYSRDFPIIDIVMNNMLKQEESSSGGRWFRVFGEMGDNQRAAAYLNGRSFEQAVLDNTLSTEVFYEMMKLKGVFLRNYITSRVAAEDFKKFMADFSQKYKFQEVHFTRLNNEFIRKFHFNLMDFIPGWYTTNATPLFIVKRIDADEVAIDEYTKYMVHFQVYNPTNVDGIISVNIEEREERRERRGRRGRASRREQKAPQNFVIPANSYKEIKILCDNRPGSIAINTNIAQNLPSDIRYHFGRITSASKDTVSGIFDGNPSAFAFDPKEITVDNEDKGFRVIESNQKNTLQSLFKKENEDKYKSMNFWMPPSKWTATIGTYFYGDYINSAMYKKSGNGSNRVEWQAEIQIPGFYEVFVYNSANIERMWGSDEGPKRNQYYTVIHDDGEEEVSVETGAGNPVGWVPLGSFYFSKGAAKVSLSDRGSEARQQIVADAVKWVYTNNNK